MTCVPERYPGIGGGLVVAQTVYDELGCMTHRIAKDLANADSWEAHWDYVERGELGAPADLGLLRSESSTTVIDGFAEDFTVTTVFEYNAHHQVKSTELQLPESVFLGDVSNKGCDAGTGDSSC